MYRDYKSTEVIHNGIKIVGIKNFDLHNVFECGQCFRWEKTKNGTYIGVALGKVIEVELEKNNLQNGESISSNLGNEKLPSRNNLIIHNTNMGDFNNIWEKYFDLNRDYDSIKQKLKQDPILKKSIDFGSGIRILQQDPFETTISFIISANNRIPMIKKEIKNICKTWGKMVLYNNEEYYTFPTIEDLSKATVEEIAQCGVGFRAKYIFATVQSLFRKEVNLDKIKELEDGECQKKMQELQGVGPKVADCIILFSMGKYTAFPVDVWVKRAMQHFYLAPDMSLPKIRQFAINKFGAEAGFAQQYLFYWARENHITV